MLTRRRRRAVGPTLAAVFCLGWTAGAAAGPAGIDQAELLRTIQARQIGADPATVVAVSLGNLEAKARCGRTLVVADGTAAGALTVNAACTQAAPLVVRAREMLGPVIRG